VSFCRRLYYIGGREKKNKIIPISVLQALLQSFGQAEDCEALAMRLNIQNLN